MVAWPTTCPITMKPNRTTKRPVRMQEIADIAGVSKSTVSRALAESPLISEKTREAIRAIARQHGYRLNKKARNFQSSSTLTIAVVVQEPDRTEWSFTDPFFLQLLGSIANELDSLGHELLLANIRIELDEWVRRHIIRGQCDGAIVLHKGQSHERLNSIAETATPLVAWGGKTEDQRYCTVGSDNRLGGYLATDHLLAQGRSRIAFAGQFDLPELALRHSGYVDAHEKNGLSICPELTVYTGISSSVAEKDFANFLASNKGIDAVVATSDVVALGVMRALVKSGRSIPDDVALVGYDDIEIARSTSPSLSTIRQDCRQGADYLVRKVMRLIDGGNVRSKILHPELVVRESSRS